MAQVTVVFGGTNVSTHKITHTPFLVGRDSTCDVAIDNVGVSRSHCKFTHDGKRFYVEDAGSSNGTYHRGQKVLKAPIADGDEVQLGKHKLIFNRSASEPAPPQKGGVAAAAAGSPGGPGGGGPSTEKDALSDGMMTFKMDARLIHQQMSGERRGSGPQRAAQLAGSMSGVSKKSGGGVFRLFLGLIILGGLAAAVLYALRELKILEL